jgi:hypothetical protein
LAWEPPTTNADGTALRDLAGYRLYRSEVSGGHYSLAETFPAAARTTGAMECPPDSYWVLTAYDTHGNESAYSNELHVPGDQVSPPEACADDPDAVVETASPIVPLDTGSQPYTDRSYEVTAFPDDLDGACLVQLPNAHRTSKQAQYLQLEPLVPLRVVIGYDMRRGIPSWLKDTYTRRGDFVQTTDDSRLELWERNVPAGEFWVPGNQYQITPEKSGSHYVVFLVTEEN